jgi:hypothetical protein
MVSSTGAQRLPAQILQANSTALAWTHSAEVFFDICGEYQRINGHNYLWITLEMRDALVAKHEHAAAHTCTTMGHAVPKTLQGCGSKRGSA